MSEPHTPSSRIEALDVFIFEAERDTPYLGPLGEGETVNRRGYIVRKGNGTIYPTTDRSVLVRVRTRDGIEGWGETYGLCAPKAVSEILLDVIAPIVEGASIESPPVIWDALYDLMRVRGYTGGFYADALAAVDIALWDVFARALDRPLHGVLGGRVHPTLPAYVSGLPAASLAERVALAGEWAERGFADVKFAAVVSHEGVANEICALRDGLGANARIAIDCHWKYTAAEAIALARDLTQAQARPWFLEAPVKPENISGLARVHDQAGVSIAAGEEWRTEHDAKARLHAVDIVQPEMGHTGITQFQRIAGLASAQHLSIIPHATIGVGVFLAASLHASSVHHQVRAHEYQHSIMHRYADLLDGSLSCAAGRYAIPEGSGLGVKPNATFFQHATHVT